MITDRRSEFEATLGRTAEARGQEAGAALARASLLRDAIYRFSRNRAAVVAAFAFAALVAFVVFVPILSNEDPYAVDFSQSYLRPSLEHPFGTDEFGRDLLVRTALGGRVALTIASWFTTARVMRGQIITLKENDYVRAANALGARWYRILFRHLLPNTLGVILIFVFLELPGVVLGEAFLSFLGLGIEAPKASWGSLAQDGYTSYQAHPYIIIIPALMISWLILSAFFIADGLRDALDPRTREKF
jgi:ABC-type dipeptide/oligopeptide/nickel transport system permease subunit